MMISLSRVRVCARARGWQKRNRRKAMRKQKANKTKANKAATIPPRKVPPPGKRWIVNVPRGCVVFFPMKMLGGALRRSLEAEAAEKFGASGRG